MKNLALVTGSDPNRGEMLAAEERRVMIVRLLTRGYSDGEIAAALNIAPSTVASERRAIRETWADSIREDANLLRNRELANIEEALRTAWRAYEKSTEDEVTEIQDREADGDDILDDGQDNQCGRTDVKRRTAGRARPNMANFPLKKIRTIIKTRPEGSPALLSAVIALIKSRRELLGIDAPTTSMHLAAVPGDFPKDMQLAMMRDPKMREMLLNLEQAKAEMLALPAGAAKVVNGEPTDGRSREDQRDPGLLAEPAGGQG